MTSRTAYSTWTPQKPTLFDGHYLRNRSTLDIGVKGYIGRVQHKEHPPEVWSVPPGTPCILESQTFFADRLIKHLFFSGMWRHFIRQIITRVLEDYAVSGFGVPVHT